MPKTDYKSKLRLLGLVLGLGLFGWIAADAVAQVQTVVWPPLPIAAVVWTLALAMAAHVLRGAAWTLGARQIAPQLGWTEGMAAFWIAFLGRYLPGKIWQVAGLSLLARGKGADAIQIAGYSLAFLVAFQLIGMIVLLEAFLLQQIGQAWLICLASAPFIGFGLALIYVVVSGPLFGLLPVSYRDRLRGALHQPVGALAVTLSLLVLVWILLASCGHALVTGFDPDWTGTWAQSAAATIGGMIAGFLVLIAPAGAGVREATTSVWLAANGVDPVTSIVIVIALRVIMTISDLFSAGFGWLKKMQWKERSPTA